jgi:tagatose-1,6-bisphosphate aldolase
MNIVNKLIYLYLDDKHIGQKCQLVKKISKTIFFAILFFYIIFYSHSAFQTEDYRQCSAHPACDSANIASRSVGNLLKVSVWVKNYDAKI